MGVRVPLKTLVGLYPSETDVHGLCGLGSFGVTVTTPLPTPCQQAPAFATMHVGPVPTAVGGLPRPVRAAFAFPVEMLLELSGYHSLGELPPPVASVVVGCGSGRLRCRCNDF